MQGSGELRTRNHLTGPPKAQQSLRGRPLTEGLLDALSATLNVQDFVIRYRKDTSSASPRVNEGVAFNGLQIEARAARTYDR